MGDFERLYGEDYPVIHRNGRVTVALPSRPSAQADPRFEGPLWTAVVRFWAVIAALTALASWGASRSASHLGGRGSEPHPDLILAVTIGGGLLATVIAWASRLTVTDRRLVFSGWVVGLVLPAAVAFFAAAGAGPGTSRTLAAVISGGAGLFLAFLITILMLSRSSHHR